VDRQRIESYRDLIAWQKAMDLVDVIYRATAEFPRREIFGLTSQMRRAAVSVPSNIAEGYSRRRPVEYVRFVDIARASLAELETQLLISRRQGMITDAALAEAQLLLVDVSKLLYRLGESLRRAAPGQAQR
jgi:four helix bundle protein